MKPIIMNMKDMSDSIEVYESRPNRALIYIIYLLAAILIIGTGWMYFSHMDIVVKSNGIFRSNEEAIYVSVGNGGVIVECNIEEGQYVEKGDILFVIEMQERTAVVAEVSGYIYLMEQFGVGSYVVQGVNLCQILPENGGGYYAEIYVENQDIAKIKEGQEVKFEIPAYPSSEYGYFTGVIVAISKDIKVEQSSGSAYYLVKVQCNQTTVTNKEGKTGTIINGMACQAKIIVDEKNVLKYLLEKLGLV